ncbi:hypothetical protein SO802_005636 [Lithocarpus litseifolius]|uniref:DUF4283 domain-containing protein n=1 Tax=Lithocarpus litseifolius TaxID=425828 RepID=A0AAW2DLH2_9ROSI
MKLEELNPSEDCVIDAVVAVIIVVVTILPVSHQTKSAGSYKDRLLGSIPGAYEQAFGLDSAMHEDYAFDVEETSLEEGVAAVGVSKEDKVRIRALWNLTLIVKTFGRNVGFLYLSTKIRTQGNPIGKMDCIDVGHDYFLIRFELQGDLESVLRGGPWIVGSQFLAIRQWEPDFIASSATFSSVAV